MSTSTIERRHYLYRSPHCLRANGGDPLVQGWESRLAGFGLRDNPRTGDAAEAWDQGWREADEDAARASRRVLRRAE